MSSISSLPPVRGRQKKRRRKRPQGANQNDLFSSFVLNRDPECSKYLPYNEVVYPKLFNRPREAEAKSPSQASAQLDEMWMVGFLEETQRTQQAIMLKELKSYIQLPGSTVLPGCDATLKRISSLRRSESDSDAHSSLTEMEHAKLHTLERRLQLESKGLTDFGEHRREGVRAIQQASKKLQKVLRGDRPPQPKASVRSLDIEAIFERNRIEREAAVTLQRAYLFHYRRRKFREMIYLIQKIVRIQALARGMIARRFVAEWFARRSVMILGWQTVIRGFLARVHWRDEKERQRKTAIRIQAFARGYLGRCKAQLKRVNIAALRIQCLWRGCVERVRIDRLWLDKQVTLMQLTARKVVAMRLVNKRRQQYTRAVSAIQRCVRGWIARNAKDRLMWSMEHERRVMFLWVLASEEDSTKERISTMKRRVQRLGLREKLADLLEKEKLEHESVSQHLSAAKELELQKTMLSPRALQQGWKEELETNLMQHREWITEAKFKAVFDTGFRARQLEEEIERRSGVMQDMLDQATRLSRWREEELLSIWEREARHRFNKKYIHDKQLVADVKREWRCKLYSKDGKPMRRQSITGLDEVRSEVFTGGAVDLFAGINDASEVYCQGVMGRQVSDGQRDQHKQLMATIAKIQLQTHRNQVAQFEARMAPIQSILTKAHNASSGLMPASQPEPEPEPEPGYAAADAATDTAAVEQPRAVVLCRKKPASSAAPASPKKEGNLSGFVELYGAATSLPDGPPQAPGASGCLVKFDETAEDRMLARIRQRRMLAAQREGRSLKRSKPFGRVPWSLLDELEGEKVKLAQALEAAGERHL
ncbi:unnamed protein product [Chrysoparadoxa australica]